MHILQYNYTIIIKWLTILVMDVKEAQQIMRIQEQSLRELQRQFGAMENPPSIYLEVCFKTLKIH